MNFFSHVCIFCVLSLKLCYGTEEIRSYADEHAPISVMGDHLHKKKEIMFSYRISKMSMSKIYSGNDSQETARIFSKSNSSSKNSGTYMNAPISMNMQMQMFGIMYAPSDRFTLMAMGKYSQKEMTQEQMPMSGSRKFDVNSEGIGDTNFSLLIKNKAKKKIKSHYEIGLSLPTGSINCRDTTPSSLDSRLGYMMQNGSGTWDPFFSYNNLFLLSRYKIGKKIYFKIPSSGKNNKGYEYGKTLKLSIWSSYRWIDNVSSSVKINYEYKGYLKGFDSEMNPRMSPSMDSRNSGHQKLKVSFGLNIINYKKNFYNHRIGIEAMIPLLQKYRGLQMGEKYRLMFGWQYGI